jgi:CheY-like chemotaxis protein
VDTPTTVKPIHVLYVEDDPQSRQLMELIICMRMKLPNLTVFENSENFTAAVEALNPKPTIIFLDIHMKPITGFEMLAILRQFEWTKQVPIIALTASVMNEEVQQLRTAGFNGCLAKPLNLGSFPETFKRIMDGETVWRIID